MQTRTSFLKERLEIFESFLMHVISEYKDEIAKNNCSNSDIIALVAGKNSKNSKLKKHLEMLKNTIRSSGKNLSDRIEEEIIIDFLVDYFKKSKKKIFFARKIFETVLQELTEYLDNDSKYIYYFSPIHNFKSDFESIQINQITKIRQVSDTELSQMIEFGQAIPTVKANLDRVSHIILTKIERDSHHEPRSEANGEIQNTCNILKIFKEGDIRTGGLYSIAFSESWNPRNLVDKIEFEPFKVYSKNKLLLDDSKQLEKFCKNLKKCFPHVKNRDFFDIAIRRFGIATNQISQVDKITDFVIALEALLVAEQGGIASKLSHRLAPIVCKNDKEIMEVLKFIPAAYNVRSGLVHGDDDRPLIIDDKTIELSDASKKLEHFTREAIQKMIIYTQSADNIELNHDQIKKKIEHLVYDRSLLDKFRRITK